MSNENPADPLEFMRRMWGNMGFSLPGMVAPTFDVDELDKRIAAELIGGWPVLFLDNLNNIAFRHVDAPGLEEARAVLTGPASAQPPVAR